MYSYHDLKGMYARCAFLQYQARRCSHVHEKSIQSVPVQRQEIFTILGAARHQKFSSSSKGSLVLVRSRPCWPIAVLVVT